MNKEDIVTKKAPQAIGPYSQAVKVKNMIFVSGQIGVKAKSGEFAGNDIESQTKQVFKNLEEILYACGADLNNIVKVTVFLTQMKDFAKMNAIYEKNFSKPYPARATVEVAKLPKGALVEIECIALI